MRRLYGEAAGRLRAALGGGSAYPYKVRTFGGSKAMSDTIVPWIETRSPYSATRWCFQFCDVEPL
jgi:hypothetical protein